MPCVTTDQKVLGPEKPNNSDLEKINDWAFQWKMTFNPDCSKQTQEIIFS